MAPPAVGLASKLKPFWLVTLLPWPLTFPLLNGVTGHPFHGLFRANFQLPTPFLCRLRVGHRTDRQTDRQRPSTLNAPTLWGIGLDPKQNLEVHCSIPLIQHSLFLIFEPIAYYIRIPFKTSSLIPCLASFSSRRSCGTPYRMLSQNRGIWRQHCRHHQCILSRNTSRLFKQDFHCLLEL